MSAKTFSHVPVEHGKMSSQTWMLKDQII